MRLKIHISAGDLEHAEKIHGGKDPPEHMVEGWGLQEFKGVGQHK